MKRNKFIKMEKEVKDLIRELIEEIYITSTREYWDYVLANKIARKLHYQLGIRTFLLKAFAYKVIAEEREEIEDKAFEKYFYYNRHKF